jgi:hypothetical protein
MKEDLPWFKHKKNARSTGGAKALIAQYGYEGYGRYNALLEIISEQPGAILDLSLKKNRNGYAGDLRFTPAEFDTFLAFLANPDECGLITYEDGKVRADDTDQAYSKVEKKRTGNRGQNTNGEPSDDHIANSDNQNGDSDDRNDTEQSRAEENRKEQQPRARNELSTSKKNAFEAWALEEAKKAGAKRPQAYARSIIADPKRLEEWMKSLETPKSDKTFAPEPATPCDCGGKIHADRITGTGQCEKCGKWYHYDPEWEWLPDTEPSKSHGDEFEDVPQEEAG